MIAKWACKISKYLSTSCSIPNTFLQSPIFFMNLDVCVWFNITHTMLGFDNPYVRMANTKSTNFRYEWSIRPTLHKKSTRPIYFSKTSMYFQPHIGPKGEKKYLSSCVPICNPWVQWCNIKKNLDEIQIIQYKKTLKKAYFSFSYISIFLSSFLVVEFMCLFLKHGGNSTIFYLGCKGF